MLTHAKTKPSVFRRWLLAALLFMGLGVGLLGGANLAADHNTLNNHAPAKIVAGPADVPEPH
jgi:hypothetical protein